MGSLNFLAIFVLGPVYLAIFYIFSMMNDKLYSSVLGRTAAIVRQRGDIRDLLHDDARGVDGTDSRLTALSGTFNVNLHSAQTEVVGNLGAVLGHHLGRVGGVLLGTSVTHLTSGRPRDNLAVVVGEGNDHVVEGGIDKRFTRGLDSNDSLLR